MNTKHPPKVRNRHYQPAGARQFYPQFNPHSYSNYDVEMESRPSYYDYPPSSYNYQPMPSLSVLPKAAPGPIPSSAPSTFGRGGRAGPSTDREFQYRNRQDFHYFGMEQGEPRDFDPAGFQRHRSAPVRETERGDVSFLPDHSRHSKRDNKVYKKTTKPVTRQPVSRADVSGTDLDIQLCVCPGCSHPFEFFCRTNQLTGRVPLILNCKHTVCQECVQRMAIQENIVCPECHNPSVLTDRRMLENLQEAFPVNCYVLGVAVLSRYKGLSNAGGAIGLVPAEQMVSTSPQRLQGNSNNTETCCFVSCKKQANLRCIECNEVYCSECSTTVHKSVKSLWDHQQYPIEGQNVFKSDLERCDEHNMDVEFLCKDCAEGACCYCFLEKHGGHDKDNLAKLSDEEMQELQSYKENTEKILKQLLISERRIKDLRNFNTLTARKKICSYFINLYSKLYLLERKLDKEVINFQGLHSSANLDSIHSDLTTSIETLKQVVLVCDEVDFRKQNLKCLLEKLKELQDTPCYLSNPDDKELDPIKFEADSVLDKLEDMFKISKQEEARYVLLSSNDLPADYKKDPAELQYEADVESCLNSLHKGAARLNNKKHVALSPKLEKNDRLDGLVEVTHIESLECFYVQLKNNQFKFQELYKDIKNYAKLASPVEQPQLNEIYLALYTAKNEKRWCRGRLVEFKNGEKEPLYEIFFIDFGSTQTIQISKLKEITPNLLAMRPFAIQCELYNPASISWNKNAHVYMGKIINGKEVFMVVKNVHNGVHVVDLMVCSSDGGMTSLVDIMINTCTNPLSTVSDDTDSVCSQRSNFVPETKVFANSRNFEKNEQCQVILANVLDPHNIFVQVASNAEALQKMTNEMRMYYRNMTNAHCIPIEGSYVAVQHKDPVRGNWHRALIKKVNLNNETISALLVDWGNTITAPWRSIRLLAEEFIRLECQAILVKLAHIEPHGSSSVWSEEATIFLQRYFVTQEPLKMKVVKADPLEVALFEMKGDVDICINAQMVAENHADSTGNMSQIVEWSNMKIQQGFKGEDGFVDGLLEKADESDDDEAEEKDSAVVKQPISVIKVVDPNLIYIKFTNLAEKEVQLHRELQIHYFKERETKDSWEVDDFCVIPYENIYIRGKILEKLPGDMYKINVFDQADETVVHISHIYICTKYFTTFRNVLYKAKLGNILPAGGNNWSLTSTEALQKIFDNYKDIYGTKIDDPTNAAARSKIIPMQMWYAKEKIGGALEANITKFVSINNKLVKLGFAYKYSPKNGDGEKLLKSLSPKTAEKESEITKTKSEGDTESPGPSCKDANQKISIQDEGAQDEDKTSATLEDKKCDEDEKGEEIKGMTSLWCDIVEDEEKKKSAEHDSPYRTKEADIDDWLPPFPIKSLEFHAHITCAEIEGFLYLREETYQKVYEEMEENIKEYFANQPSAADVEHKWEVGQLCTIAYEGKFYRGKIYSIDDDGITAVMIDFGSDHKVAPNKLYREILYPKIPAFASKVKLDRVYPKCGKWLSSDYENFMEHCPKYAKIEVKSSLELEVPLVEVYSSDGVNINQLLVQSCPNLTRCEVQDLLLSDEDDNVVIEDEESMVYDPEKDEVNLARLRSPQQKYILTPLPECSFGERMLMTVIAVLTYKKVVIKPADSIPTQELELGDLIQEHYMDQPVVDKVEIGMPCICPYSEDGLWYRAEVYNIDGWECGYVFVYFVDFGNVESVSITSIRQMKKEWFDLPVSSHIAELNIVLNSDKSSDSHVFQYVSKLYSKDKYVRIVCRDPLKVHLYEENDELCYESLLKSGLIKLESV